MSAPRVTIHSMKLHDWLTRRNVIAGASLLIIILVVAGFLTLRRPPRVAMERYVPADALAFIEIDSLTDLLDGLTATKAWRELAPELGLSSQLKQVGFVTDLIGRTGLGPDEAVLAGRAQCAIAVTGIQSQAGETTEGPYIHLKPHFAVLIETHMPPETAKRLVRDRASIIAQRIYDRPAVQESEDYQGAQLFVFHGPGSDRQVIASSAGSLVLVANHTDAIKPVLDAIAGRAQSLAGDATLKQMRGEIDHESSLFAYVTVSGIRKLVELWPVMVAGRAASESVSLFGDLIEHVSAEAQSSLLYSLKFESGGVTEKYLTALNPGIAEALAEPLKAASSTGFQSLSLIPRASESVTLIGADKAGELPERVLKQLTPNLDIVAGVALREFVINFRKQYGLAPADSVSDAIGNEIALVNFGDDQPRAMLIRVVDRSRLQPFVVKYLTHSGILMPAEHDDGTEIMISSDAGRAAAFVGDFLVLGTRDQIVEVLRTQSRRDGLDGDERLKRSLANRPINASVISYHPSAEDAGRLLLALSKLMRVTDGSRELIEGDTARRAIERMPPSVSFTEFRGAGVYTETHSAVGNLSAIGSLIGTDE